MDTTVHPALTVRPDDFLICRADVVSGERRVWRLVKLHEPSEVRENHLFRLEPYYLSPEEDLVAGEEARFYKNLRRCHRVEHLGAFHQYMKLEKSDEDEESDEDEDEESVVLQIPEQSVISELINRADWMEVDDLKEVRAKVIARIRGAGQKASKRQVSMVDIGQGEAPKRQKTTMKALPVRAPSNAAPKREVIRVNIGQGEAPKRQD